MDSKTIEQIKDDALEQLKDASDVDSIKALSVRYLGRKGFVTQFLRNISSLPNRWLIFSSTACVT